MEESIDFKTLPQQLSRVLDEEELAVFIQDNLLETGVIISEADAKELSEVAFDYVVYKLTVKEDYSDEENYGVADE